MMFNSYNGKHFDNATDNKKFGKKGMALSYISLFVIFSVLATTTFSWFTQKDTATINTGAITVSATAGMRVNNGEDLSGIVKLATGVKLAEASSVDGRNMFFPTTGTFDDETPNMSFREGNAGDRNVNYFYKDFSLKSDSGETDVYVKSYKVTVGDITYDSSTQNNTICPIRIAFITDSAEEPVLIDPTARFAEYIHTYNAVSAINENGNATTKASVPSSFMQYYFAASKPAFTIKENEELDVTMVMWLEGTGGNCDAFAGKNVSVDINFESNWDYMDVIEFVDDTIGDTDVNVKHWINNDGCLVTLTYFDTKTNQNKTVMMTKSANYDTDHIWRAAIPQGIVTNITFNRYNPKVDEVWNSWYTKPGVNNIYFDQQKFSPALEESRIIIQDGKKYRSVKYVAKGGNGYETSESKRLYPCRGYWRVEDKTPVVDESTSEEVTSSTWSLPGSFNDWATDSLIFSESDTVGVYETNELTLSAGTYEFKVHQLPSNGTGIWYTNSGYNVSDNASSIVLSTSGDNMKLSASGGKYTFTLDARGGQVKLTVSAVLDGNDDNPTDTDIKINVTLSDETTSHWIYTNATNYDGLYVVFDNGTSSRMLVYGSAADNSYYFRTENMPVSSSVKIKGFEMRNAAGSTYYGFYLSSYVAVANNGWYNFKVDYQNKLY